MATEAPTAHSTSSGQAPKVLLAEFLPPKKGLTRFICVRSGKGQGQGEASFVIRPAGEIKTDRGMIEDKTKPAVVLAFKNHVCDAPAELAKLVDEIAKDTDNERLDYMTMFAPAKLLGELLEDEDGVVKDKRGMSYGGRATALSFLKRIAHNDFMANPPDKGSEAEFTMKIVADWQHRLTKWGFTRTGAILHDEDKIKALAAKHKITPEALRELIEQGLLK